MVEHCQKVHKWKEFPCSFENCNFVAYNSQSSTAHRAGFHSNHRVFTDKEFPCTWKDCKSSFSKHSNLKNHIRIHTNSLLQCVFCPYRTNQGGDLKCHYRVHFKMYDLNCEYCEKKFVSKKYLNLHYSTEHSKDIYTCHICKKYTSNRRLLQSHIRKNHKLLSVWNSQKEIFDTFTRE